MNKSEIIEVLEIIIHKSDVVAEAVQAIFAVNANSPIVQHRINRVISNALNGANTFTLGDKMLMANLINLEEDEEDTTFSFRLTRGERAELELKAKTDGWPTVTAYVKSRVGL